MSTGDTFLALQPGKVFSLADLGPNLTDSLRDAQIQVQSDLWGPGGMLDTPAVLTVDGANSRFSLDGNAQGWTPSGHRIELLVADPINLIVPFEDSGATVYDIGARFNDYPAGAEFGADGVPGFTHTIEGVGRIVNPSAVTDLGGTIELDLTGVLLVGEKWTDDTQTRQVIAWFTDVLGNPETASGDAVLLTGTLTLTGGGDYIVTVPHTFGQSSVDLTLVRYNVMIMGPTPATAAESAGAGFATDFLTIGTIISQVFDSSAAPLINFVGQFIGAFNVEHDNVTGEHTDVQAQRVQVDFPVNLPSLGLGHLHARIVRANIMEVTASLDSAGNSRIKAEQDDGQEKVGLVPGDPTVNDGGGSLQFLNVAESLNDTALINVHEIASDTRLKITNAAAGATRQATIVVDGTIEKNVAKTVPFRIIADDAVDEELLIENIGAAILDLRVTGGTVFVDGAGIFDQSAGTAFLQAIDTFDWAVDSAGNVLSSGLAQFFNGFKADPNGSGLQGYRYTTATEYIHNHNPHMGGWTWDVAAGTTVEHVAGTPSAVQSSTTGMATIRKPLDLLNKGPQDVGEVHTITDLTIRYLREDVTDGLDVLLRRQLRDGSGGVLTVASIIDPTATAGTFLTATTGFTHAVDPDYYYWLEAALDPDGNPKTDVQLSDVDVTLTKLGVE